MNIFELVIRAKSLAFLNDAKSQSAWETPSRLQISQYSCGVDVIYPSQMMNAHRSSEAEWNGDRALPADVSWLQPRASH